MESGKSLRSEVQATSVRELCSFMQIFQTGPPHPVNNTESEAGSGSVGDWTAHEDYSYIWHSDNSGIELTDAIMPDQLISIIHSCIHDVFQLPQLPGQIQ